MKAVFSRWLTSRQKYIHEAVGDRFGSPGHHTPTGDAPAEVVFAYMPQKRTPNWCLPDRDGGTQQTPGQRAKSSLELFPAVLLAFVDISRVLRVLAVVFQSPGYSASHIPIKLTGLSQYFGFRSWPGGIPHFRIRAQAVWEQDSPCDGIENVEVGVKRSQLIPFIILYPTDTTQHS